MKQHRLVRTCALIAALVLAVPQPAFAGTVTGRATSNDTKIFTFIADDAGQVLLSLSWSSRSAELFMLVIDSGDDPLTWCIAASSQDRTQRCDFGALDSQRYIIGVSSFRGSSKFQLNAQTSGSEFVARGGVDGSLREMTAEAPGYAGVVARLENATGRLSR